MNYTKKYRALATKAVPLIAVQVCLPSALVIIIIETRPKRITFCASPSVPVPIGRHGRQAGRTGWHVSESSQMVLKCHIPLS